ncbi:MAG TPA: VWA domain-containing protein [Gemmatimonadales bacterium]|nr:VWA domain-containing protein [Gemmatimonadales bacterium]
MNGAPTLAPNVVTFGRMLRRAGLDVDPGQTRRFLEALSVIGVARRADVRAAGRAIFVRRREEIPVFDAAFDLFWRRHGTGTSDELPRLTQRRPPQGRALFGSPTDADARIPGPPRPELIREPSAAESLRTADFATLTAAEMRDAMALVDAMRPALPRRPSRRPRVTRHGRRLAPRQMLRKAMGTGGEPLTWRWRRRTTRPRPIVLLCDISGSMERYSRLLLRFAHALERTGAPLEVFVFGTRLTRITRQLRVRSGDEAIRRVAAHVLDWNGGTRIGDSLHELNRRWVRRTVRSGAVVLLASDGWERGDPERLGREMATLRRQCHRLYWLDPLASRPGFEPATLGLRAALPHVDGLVPCASVASLEALATRLARQARRG